MPAQSYNDLVKEIFRFLIDGYGFVLARDEYFPEAFGNSVVEFRSQATIVLVTRDRGDILVDVGPAYTARRRFYNLATLVRFLDAQLYDGIIGEIFHPEASEEFQLRNYAHILRDYCEPVLRQDFQNWKELEEFAQKRLEEFLRQERKDRSL